MHCASNETSHDHAVSSVSIRRALLTVRAAIVLCLASLPACTSLSTGTVEGGKTELRRSSERTTTIEIGTPGGGK